MFLFSKRAIETHIMVLIVFAMFMSMILIVVLDALYGNQHEDCEDIKIEIIKKSRDKQIIRLNIESNQETHFLFREYPELDLFKVEPKEIERVSLRKVSNKITLVPIVVVDEKTFECREKIIKINLKTLI